ncbi:Uncharacterised protein [Vibrio cholerae]|nr:Uncharacterised protein [Vibrio cholerae]
MVVLTSRFHIPVMNATRMTSWRHVHFARGVTGQ